MSTASVCILLPPGPEQSSLMMTLRRCAAQSAVVSSMQENKTRAFFISVLRRIVDLRTPASREECHRPGRTKAPADPCLLLPHWPRHQIDKNLVELFRINIELHSGQPLIWWHRRRLVPEQSLPVTRPVIDVDVHVELLLPSNDRRINQRHARDLIPHKAWQRILIEIL